MLVRWAAAVGATRGVRCAVCSMRAGLRWEIMIGVPEQPAVECRPVFLRVIHINVGSVLCTLPSQPRPPCVTGSQRMQACCPDKVVLVVVVRHEGLSALVIHRLVIGIEVTKVAPAVFIDQLAPVNETVGAIQHGAHMIVPGRTARQISHQPTNRATGLNPLRINPGMRRLKRRLRVINHRLVLAKRDHHPVPFLLTALQLNRATPPGRKQAHPEFTVSPLDGLRKVLPEIAHRYGYRLPIPDHSQRRLSAPINSSFIHLPGSGRCRTAN